MLKAEEDARAPAHMVGLHHIDFLLLFSHSTLPAQAKQMALVYLVFTSQEAKAVSTQTHLHLPQLTAAGSCCLYTAAKCAPKPKARCSLQGDKRTAESRHGDRISPASLMDCSETQPDHPALPKMIINSTSSWKQGVHYASEEHYKNSAKLGYFDCFIPHQTPISKTAW